MKNLLKIFSLIVLVLLTVIIAVSCTDNGNDDSNPDVPVIDDPADNPTPTDPTPSDPTDPEEGEESGETKEYPDLAASVKLDFTSTTLKSKVTVKNFVDGDTTHFYVEEKGIFAGNVLKARYLAINTPESTGKIEEYGKAASNFTKAKLSAATSIYVESDDENWNADSTGSRYLVWVWYRTSEEEEYRNLNIEILQNGLAIASNSAQNRYGETAVAAIAQAKEQLLNVYSGKKDPDMYYGDAVELTLTELRTNIEAYNGKKVAFEANVIKDNSQTVYVEEYDPELDVYFGMPVYYGYSASGDVLRILAVGNRVRIVGLVQYYETGGTYQISGLTYRAMRPKDAGNVQIIGEVGSGTPAQYRETDIALFLDGTVEIEVDGQREERSYASLSMNSSISMTDLYVESIYTTTSEDSSSIGAMTLTCKKDGRTITIRTVVLYDENNKLITDSAYLHKVISVKGLVDYYNGTYQIKVYAAKDITVIE